MPNIVISDDPGHSSETRARLTEFRKRAADLAEDSAALEADVARLKGTAPENLTEQDIALVREIPIRRLNCSSAPPKS